MQRLALALLLWSLPATAAPICFNHAGDMVHCDAPSAMPLGWRPSPEEHRRWLAHQPPAPTPQLLLGTGLGLLAILALIALLPQFDGRRDEDWR